MVATSANFGDSLEPGLRKIFVDEFMAQEPMRNVLFNVQPMETSYVKESSVGSFGTFPVFNGNVTYDDKYQGEDVTFRPQEFSSGFKIERKLWADDLYGAIAREPRDLASAADYTMEVYASGVFNNAFTGNGVITVDNVQVMNHTHGKSLCADDHGLGTSRLSGVTIDNKGVLVLSATNVETTRREMAKFVDDAGKKIAMRPDLLLVPRDLEETGWNIIAAAGQVDSASNNRNFHQGRYKLAVWDQLESAKRWFMIDSNKMSDSLYWFDREKLEFNRDQEFDTYIARFSAYYRAAWGWREFRWIYGHDPA